MIIVYISSQISDSGNQEIVEGTIDKEKSDEHSIDMTPNAVYGIM